MSKQDIVNRILLFGTNSHAKSADSLKILSDELAFESSNQTEHDFLNYLSAEFFKRKAAKKLDKHQQTNFDEAGPENFIYCSSRAKEILAFLLANKLDEIILEWLKVHQENKKLVPPDLIFDVLTFAVKNKKNYQLIRDSIGFRGLWMAKFRKEWSFLTLKDDRSFSHGKLADRIQYITELFEKDKEQAVLLLKSVWSEENYQTKLAFLLIIEQNLSDESVELLEIASEDKKNEVGAFAIQLLSNFQEHNISLALKELVLENFHLEETDNEKYFILKLPIVSNSPKRLVNEKVKELNQKKGTALTFLLSTIDPSYFSDYYRMDFDQLLKIVKRSELFELIVKGWIVSSKKFKNKDCLIALFKLLSNEKNNSRIKSKLLLEELFDHLDDDMFNTLAIEILNYYPQNEWTDEHPILSLLLKEKRNWSRTLSFKVLEKIKYVFLDRNSVFYWNQISIFKKAAFCVPPNLYEEIASVLSLNVNHSLGHEVNNFLDKLKIRKEITELY